MTSCMWFRYFWNSPNDQLLKYQVLEPILSKAIKQACFYLARFTENHQAESNTRILRWQETHWVFTPTGNTNYEATQLSNETAKLFSKHKHKTTK